MNVTAVGGVSTAGVTPVCRRMNAIRFPAAATGAVTSLSLAVARSPATEACAVTLTLTYVQTSPSFADVAVGAPFTTSFVELANSAAVALDVSSAGWTISNLGGMYFVTLQTATVDAFGAYCALTLPYATGPASLYPAPSWYLQAGYGPRGSRARPRRSRRTGSWRAAHC